MFTAEISDIICNFYSAWSIAGFHNKYDLYELYTSIFNYSMMIKQLKWTCLFLDTAPALQL